MATRAIWLLFACAATSCLSVDNEGPILSVELYWDERTDSSGFRGGDCRSADVGDMEWTLYRLEGDDMVELESIEQECTNAIDFGDPPPGDYQLSVTGFDAQGRTVWNDDCSPLTVTRFDVVYECDITAP
jgi:hypothetical protein